jgi:hypothetical protein
MALTTSAAIISITMAGPTMAVRTMDGPTRVALTAEVNGERFSNAVSPSLPVTPACSSDLPTADETVAGIMAVTAQRERESTICLRSLVVR